MKRSILCILCAAVLLTGFAAPAAASSGQNTIISFNPQSDRVTQYWRITMAATVVANTGDSLVVYLESPRNMATDDSDVVDHLQTLPLDADTVFTDRDGGAVEPGAVLAGQEVRVTFRYHWQASTPRMTAMDRCLAVELTGARRPVVSTAQVDDFGRDELVGTVLSVSGRQMELFVESGRVFYGDVEYIVRGKQRVTLPADASVLGADGRSILPSAIRPFQRVVLRASDALWAESMPPQYALQQAGRVQVLADGEKVLTPATLAARNRVTATVLSISRTDGGLRYTVQPAQGSRERALSETYTVAAPILADFDEPQQAALAAIGVGTVVDIQYSGLVYAQGVQPRLDWTFSIQLHQS